MRPDRAFEVAYVDLFARAERTARLVLQDSVAAEDLAAETMVRAFVSWRRIAPYAEAWVTRVATNLAIDSLRRVRPLAPVGITQSTDDMVLDRRFIVAALGRLTARQRQSLALRFLVGLTEQETATLLDVSPETIRTHIRRGIATLQSRFGRDLEEALYVAYGHP